jgi:hypothetical protein
VPDLKIIGQQKGNPLDVLNAHLEEMKANLKTLADIAMVNASHTYALMVLDLPQHGKVWAAYCIACSHVRGEPVYPCRLHADDPVRPPGIFTVGRVLVPREDGSFLVHEQGSATSS